MPPISGKSSFDGNSVAKNLNVFMLFDFVFVVWYFSIHYVTYNWRYTCSTVVVTDIFSIELTVT